MSRIVATMAGLHMVVDGGPPPKFPLWAVYGVSDFDSAGRPLGDHAEDYEAALARILRWHGQTDEIGIPLHKLRTNLGWHVTKIECEAAMSRYDRWTSRGEPRPTVFGERLIPFLRASALIDGFEVH